MTVKETSGNSLSFSLAFSLPLNLFRLMEGTEQAIICQELIFWFPHSATVADQHLTG